AKLPDDRYQSASGVRHDLASCLREWTGGGKIDPFILGQADVMPPIRPMAKIYGREDEIARLKNSVTRARSDGRAQLVLLSGPSGIGKTELIRCLRQDITERKALFASGKCDAAAQGLPYAVPLSALEDLLLE